MDELQELLDRINSDEALAEMENDGLAEAVAQLDAELERLEGEPTTEESIARMAELNDAIDRLGAEAAARFEDAAELTRRAEEQAARRRARAGESDEDETDADETEPVEGETDDEATADEDEAPEGETDDSEQIAAAARPARRGASAPALARLAHGRGVPAARAQRSRTAQRGPAIVAGPDLRTFALNQRLRDYEEVTQAFIEAAESTRGGADGRYRVATIDWRDQYPRERNLVAAASSEEQWGIVRDLVMPGGEFPQWQRGVGSTPEALVAAGGLCAPPEVRYDVVSLSTAERPLRDGLPSVRADRGALLHVNPPVPSSVVLDQSGGAVGAVTVSQDSGGATKTIQEFTCPSQVTDQVTGLYERIKFGNFADRYFPENMRAVQQTTRAVFARQAERRLFETLRAASLLLNTRTTLNPLGALPNFLSAVRTAVRNYRYQYRLPETTTMRIVLPTWLEDIIAYDLYAQAPGDDTLTRRTDERAILEDKLAEIGVRPIWQRDDARTADANGAGGIAFSNVTANGNLTDISGLVSAILFHEGAWLFLDGGQLDLGIVRDTTSNAANRFETFYEVWETAAMVGYASWNLTFQLCGSGLRAALATVDCGGYGS